MSNRVALVGIGLTECQPGDRKYSHKELLYLATKQALDDAGIERQRITSAFTTSLDFYEGRALSNQFALDSVGGVMKACDMRLGEDGIYGVCAAYMEVLCKPAQIVVVGSVFKTADLPRASNAELFLSFLEPGFVRPVYAAVSDPGVGEHCMAAMRARRYMHLYGVSECQLARVAVKNYGNASRNPKAAYRKAVTTEEVMRSRVLSKPLTSLMVARECDAACTLVLVSEDVVSGVKSKPVWVSGVGWCSDTSYPGTSELARAEYITVAARQAYAMAGITHPARDVDVAEVYDTFSFDELQFCEALGLCGEGEGGDFIDEGVPEIGGALPVNPSGGLLGCGNPLGTAGLMKVAQAALQVRGEAGDSQVPGAEVAVAQGYQWPNPSGGVVVLTKW